MLRSDGTVGAEPDYVSYLDGDGSAWIECDHPTCTYYAVVLEWDGKGQVFMVWDEVFKVDMPFERYKQHIEEVLAGVDV
jgi:hypothetical protein